ncbi:MAG: SDR family NAD(P)-dependent oxidoreductase [Deltaproteobacteria bacterium]|nr:SDR family NAD(P)-dependent oxidoreductase [Deltaproteobacteria bacterium]
MKAVLLGATKGIGRALARAMVARGDTVFLLGRSASDLADSAADLQVRGNNEATVGTATCDLEDPATFEPALAAAHEALGGLDAVIVTAGMFATQDALEADRALLTRMLTVNFAHTVVFCEHAKTRLLEDGGGVLCVFSSVAGDRGRKPVVLYGASKAGLSAYLEGLDHREHGRGLRTVCIKPGFVRTSMTAGLPEPPFASDAEPVALRALAAIDRSRPITYAPRIWGLIMLVIRWVPRFVMRRVGF